MKYVLIFRLYLRIIRLCSIVVILPCKNSFFYIAEQSFKYNKFHKRYTSEEDIEKAIKDSGIHIVYFNEHHFKAYKSLQIGDNHKDIIDHSIIAQAISDKIPLISSDNEFHDYISQGLNFIFNKRR